jgi:tRNA pseudouridine38-40 synthase
MVLMNEPLSADVPEGFIRVRGGIAYDGTNFAGWGIQPSVRTVQGDLEDSLARILRHERMPVSCAGRTDSGVHATGQVFHVDIPEATFPGLNRLKYRLNSDLENDVVVTGLSIAPPGFDARFSALSRTYEYLINDGLRNPLTNRFVYDHGYRVDVDLMNQAAVSLLGLHDFTAFCKPKDFGTNIRDLKEFNFARREDGVIVARVRADAFCYSMVRMLVGAHLDVGAGRKPVSFIAEYLAGQDRHSGVYVAPARGLTFVEVEYPSDDELAQRAALTRRTRDVGELPA